MNINNKRTTSFVGQVFMDFKTLPSTNVYAVEYLSKNTPTEGTVISTRDQTAGRGQIGSKWESEADKNISLSVILYPRFLAATDQFYLIKIIGLAVKECLDEYLSSTSIKWPNDIYVQNKKIAGILIQNALQGSVIKHTIVGIGININQKIFLSDAPNPTSLSLETSKKHDLSTIINDLCFFVEKWYLRLKAKEWTTINNAYRNNLYRINGEHKYQEVATGNIFTGKIIGTSPSGQLEIETRIGLKRFNIKEVKFIL